jgi:nucleotide-binding universal stress UspA family protein
LNRSAREESDSWAPRTIVVGYDGTCSAEQALMHAFEVARAFDSRVVIADVAAPQSLQGTPGGFGYAPYYALTGGSDPRMDEALRQQHRASIDSLFARSGVPHEFVGLFGEQVAAIVEVAEQEDADLIVVGRCEPGFLARMFDGNISQGVSRRAHRDVLVVPASHSENSS